MCVAPTWPRSSSSIAMAMPIMLTSRDIRYGACVAMGSANGGSQMRVGKRRRLMVHVNDLRFPLPPGVLHHARLDHVQHVGVAIVVVADVLLVKHRQRPHRLRCAGVLHVPLGDHLLAVRIDRRPQHQDHVVENRGDLRTVRSGQDRLEQLRRVLRARQLGRVQPAVDVDERLALFGQRSRASASLRRFRMRQTPARFPDSDRFSTDSP